MNEQTPPKKKRRWLPLLGGLVLFLCVCSIVAVLFAPDTDTPSTTSSNTLAEQEEAAPTDVPEATDAPEATDEPKATEIPIPTEAPPGIGTRIESGGIALTVAQAYLTDSFDTFLKPEDGFTFLVVEVIIENVDRDEAPYNPLYFAVKDSQGFEYTTAFSAPEPTLKSGEAAKGELARGFVAFEVQEGATGLVVSYEPLVILGGYETIRIALGDGLEVK